jgi:hypothetical protein
MSMTVIVVGVVILLLVGISVSSYVQHREQAAAERRHRIAQHRACVRDGQEMLDLGANLPFDASVRDVLLDYMGNHLITIRDLDPTTPSIDESISFVTQQRNKPLAQFELKLPTQTEQLTALRTQLHRLTEFVARMRADSKIDTAKAQQAFQYLARLRLRCDVEGHLKLAQLALMNKQIALAMQYAKYAYDRMVQENISDSYVQEQMANCERLTQEIRTAQALEAGEESPTDVNTEEKSEVDNLFGQKKKW